MTAIDSSFIFASMILHLLGDVISQPLIFLYLGPETIMPLGSAIAAIVGFLLIGWRWIAALFRKIVGKTNKGSSTEDTSTEQPNEETPG